MATSPATLTSSGARSLWPATPAGRFGLSASLVVVAYVALPARPVAEVLSVAVITAAAVAVLAGVATYEPARRSSWLFVAAAIAVHGLAAAIRGWEIARGEDGARSEAIASLAYPPMLVGAWGVSARRLPAGFGDRRWAIATTAACAMVWLLVVQPTLADGSLPLHEADRVGFLALLDLVLIAVVGRRLIASPEHNASLRLAAAAFVVWGNSHAVVGSQVYGGSFVTTSLAAGSLLVGPVLLGAAALHPDMAHTAPTGGSLRWYGRSVRELTIASVAVVVVTATMVAATTGRGETVLAATILVAAIVAVGSEGAERAAFDRLDGTDEQTAAPLTSEESGGVEDGDSTGDEAPAAVLPIATISRGSTDLTCDELELAYLPYVDLATGAVLGAEALVRRRHAQRGVLAPADFLGAPSSPEARLVDSWVVTQALSAAASWSFPALVGINVGPARLADRAWTELLLETAEELGLDAGRVVVETSERAFLDEQGQAFAHAQRLQRAGVTIVVDDFGREVGSLRTLAHAPVDIVKLRVGPLGRWGRDVDVTALQAVRSAGHRTAVVGVDRPQLLAAAQHHRIEIGQGFTLSRPLPESLIARGFGPGPAGGPRSTAPRRATSITSSATALAERPDGVRQ